MSGIPEVPQGFTIVADNVNCVNHINHVNLARNKTKFINDIIYLKYIISIYPFANCKYNFQNHHHLYFVSDVMVFHSFFH